MARHKELEPLVQQRQVLVRQYDRSEISFEEFSKKYQEVNDKYWKLVRETIDNTKTKLNEQDKIDSIRRKKMEEQIKEEKKKNFKPRGPKKDSYASYIIEGLKRKTLDNPDKVADWVVDKKPGRDAKKVRAQVVVMVNEIKKGKKPLYTWNEDEWTVTEVGDSED